MTRLTHDDPDRVLACPACDKAKLYERAGEVENYTGDDPVACHNPDCEWTGGHDEIVDRPNAHDPQAAAAAAAEAHTPSSKTAQALMDANPDAIGGD